MNTYLLLHNGFKRIGWIILIPATILGIILALNGYSYNSAWLTTKVFALIYDVGVFSKSGSCAWIEVDLSNTLVALLWLIGAMMVGFSKEKREDEFIANLRLSSLLWSVWVNYILLFFAFIFIYGTPFFNVMVYNMFTILIIFIIRFNFILFRNSKMATDEK